MHTINWSICPKKNRAPLVWDMTCQKYPQKLHFSCWKTENARYGSLVDPRSKPLGQISSPWWVVWKFGIIRFGMMNHFWPTCYSLKHTGHYCIIHLFIDICGKIANLAQLQNVILPALGVEPATISLWGSVRMLVDALARAATACLKENYPFLIFLLFFIF